MHTTNDRFQVGNFACKRNGEAKSIKIHLIHLYALVFDFPGQCHRQSLERKLGHAITRIVRQAHLPVPRADVHDLAVTRGDHGASKDGGRHRGSTYDVEVQDSPQVNGGEGLGRRLLPLPPPVLLMRTSIPPHSSTAD